MRRSRVWIFDVVVVLTVFVGVWAWFCHETFDGPGSWEVQIRVEPMDRAADLVIIGDETGWRMVRPRPGAYSSTGAGHGRSR